MKWKRGCSSIAGARPEPRTWRGTSPPSTGRRSGGGRPSCGSIRSPPAVTVGFHQDPGLILDLDAVREDGLEVVRRITGGRALLHESELTYCVVAPAGTALFDAGRGDTFRRVSAAIADALVPEPCLRRIKP